MWPSVLWVDLPLPSNPYAEVLTLVLCWLFYIAATNSWKNRLKEEIAYSGAQSQRVIPHSFGCMSFGRLSWQWGHVATKVLASWWTGSRERGRRGKNKILSRISPPCEHLPAKSQSECLQSLYSYCYQLEVPNIQNWTPCGTFPLQTKTIVLEHDLILR